MTDRFIISPQYILPIEPAETVLEEHSLIVQAGVIIAILPTNIARQTYQQCLETVLSNHVVMPGLINLHNHMAMTLLRGYADDLALMDWLKHYIWPAEKQHVSQEFVFDGSLIGMAEMIKSGTTTVNDMYFYPDSVARAGLASGMRTVVGCTILDFPTNFAHNADQYLEKALNAYTTFSHEPLLQFTLAPHAPYTVSDKTFKKVIDLAEHYDLKIHCHIHETQHEIEQSLIQYGIRPLARLQKLGLLTKRLIAAHMVVCNDQELDIIAKEKISISHNPASNMKLGSGIAQINRMRDKGITVGLGTDGPASNNTLDLFAEIRLAALLAKVSGNPKALPAFEVLKMATILGAKALGIDHITGSLKVGKAADIIAVGLSDISIQPCYHIPSQLVYSLNSNAVTNVWVNGNIVLKNRVLMTINSLVLQEKAVVWRKRIKKIKQ